MKPKFLLPSGAEIDFENPSQAKPTLEDFRICMSNICRYNGGIPVNLIHHVALCVLLARLRDYTPYEIRLVAIHDHAEVFVNDLHPALKQLLPAYVELEGQFDTLVHGLFGCLPPEGSEIWEVKAIDLIALYLECWVHRHPVLPHLKTSVSWVDKLAAIIIFSLPKWVLWGIITSATGKILYRRQPCKK